MQMYTCLQFFRKSSSFCGTEHRNDSKVVWFCDCGRNNACLPAMSCLLLVVHAVSAHWHASCGIGAARSRNFMSGCNMLLAGEILPQSLCSHHGLVVGAYSAPLVKFFM
jgi:hypothetical protein